MEDYDKFRFSNRGTQKWLAVVFLVASFATWKFDPAWGLIVAGGILLLIGRLAYDYRTGVHTTSDRDPEFEPPHGWFEGWALSTGVILLVVPILGMAVRGWFL